MICEKCKSENVKYLGSWDSVNDWIMDDYECKDCGHRFTVGDYYS